MNNLLEMKHVAVNFAAYGGTVQAVRDISFSIEEGQTVALVGESVENRLQRKLLWGL